MRQKAYREMYMGNGEYISPLKQLAIIELEYDLKLKLNINAESDLKLVIGRMREIERRNQKKEPVRLWQQYIYNY